MEFFGIRMVERAIQLAIQSDIFDTIIVSTDDPDVLEIADGYHNVITMLREEHLCGDDVGVEEVVKDVLKSIKSDYICCLYPCTPLLVPDDLIYSFKQMIMEKAERCIGCAEYDVHPVYAFEVSADNKIFRACTDRVIRENAKIGMVYDTGFYWCKSDVFVQTGTLVGIDRMIGYMLPRERAVDIDTPEDLELAKFYWEKKNV
jgi:pseudaminic acid cytidylyltransferase